AALQAKDPRIIEAGPLIQVEALIEKVDFAGNRYSTGGLILGVDPERETRVTLLGENLVRGRFRQFAGGELPGPKEVVLGYLMADRIGAQTGDRISVTTSRGRPSPLGNKPQNVWLTVSGVAQANMSEFDN